MAFVDRIIVDSIGLFSVLMEYRIDWVSSLGALAVEFRIFQGIFILESSYFGDF